MMVDSVLLYGYFTSACVALRSERVIVMEPPKFEDDDWDCMCVLHLMLGRESARVWSSQLGICVQRARKGQSSPRGHPSRSGCWIECSARM